MKTNGFTLLELLVTILLIPLLGLTLYHLNFFVDQSFRRTTIRMIPEHEVEVVLGYMAKDVMVANVVQLTLNGVLVNPGTTVDFDPVDNNDNLSLTIDDDNTPTDTTDDDGILYVLSGTTLQRQYTAQPSTLEVIKDVARNITALQLVQDTNQAAAVRFPRNVVQATVTSTVGGISVTQTRVMSSRVLRADRFLPKGLL